MVQHYANEAAKGSSIRGGARTPSLPLEPPLAFKVKVVIRGIEVTLQQLIYRQRYTSAAKKNSAYNVLILT